jgi:lipoprotein-anchoring transpeptidase ErfK/SrfK
MADIYVRPYGDRGRHPIRVILLLLVSIALAAGLWWWLSRSAESAESAPADKVVVNQPVETEDAAPIVTQKVAKKAPVISDNASELFTRAQRLASDGKLKEASALLEQIINTTQDNDLRKNALRVQGRWNMDLFLSDIPTENKKRYVIQPGDSLDRIARRNETTVDLIRRINGIEGNLIYPGASLLLPAKPFSVAVDKSAKTLDLMMGDKRLKRYSVGLGRYGKTPLGSFQTVVHQTNPDWSPPTGGIIPFGDPRNVLGTRWISIQDESRPDIKGFGIHGTSDRESIGEEASNGCIRMLNEDVEEVFLLIPRGTSVVISE